MVDEQKALSLRLEILWWVVTALLVVAILFPIYNHIDDYPFWKSNTLFIIAFVTLTRYIFLLKHTFLAKRQKLKVVLFFVSIPVIFYLINEINYFQTFLDERGVEPIIGNLPLAQRNTLAQFIKTEMLLFGVGSVVAAVLFPFRMLMSVWLLRNRGRV